MEKEGNDYQFMEYMVKFGKSYKTIEEYENRKALFLKSVDEI